MSQRKKPHGALAALMLFALAGCSSTSIGVGDYPSYTEETLVAEATVVETGTPVLSEPYLLKPSDEGYQGDDPQQNPMAGFSEEEIQRAIDESEGVEGTAVTFLIDTSYRGTLEPGQEVTVVQTGGGSGNTVHVVEQEPPLQKEERYLLFMSESRIDGAFVILGGSAGMYAEDDDAFVPVRAESAPFARLTNADLESLLR